MCGIAAVASTADADGAEVLRTVFEYCQTPGWSFDADGNPATNAMSPASVSAGSVPRPDPEWVAFEHAAEIHEADPYPFLTWMDEERAVPGESAFAAGWDDGGIYVLSERGSNVRCLKRYDVRGGTSAALTPTNAPRDLLGPVWLDGGEEKAPVLAGVRWRTERGTSNEWFDARMAAADRRLAERFPGARPEWIAPSPADPRRWIVECRFSDAPPVWAEIDAETGSVAILSRFPDSVSPMVRRVFRCKASDGKDLCGIVSFPDSGGPFPLVVFPHGGPGALSDDRFDERVWALVDGGFAVLQPNYRGSVGFGKAFRLAGWGPDGIRRALDDIHEMAVAVRGDPALPVSAAKPVLLGGSWGGYCVLELLARHPDFYAGGVSFFGAFDLPALVRSEAERIGADGATDADMRTLFRQFGDPSDAPAMERLAALSPARHAGSIAAPVVMFHNRSDGVIPFAQSEAMFAALTNLGARAEFRVGEGGHGFGAAEEAQIYGRLLPLLKSWISGRGALPGGGRRARMPGVSTPSRRDGGAVDRGGLENR